MVAKGSQRPAGEYGPGNWQVGRKYPTHTRLGAVMKKRGFTAREFAALTGIHPRVLTDYLADRKELLPHHLVAAAEVLRVPAERLTEPKGTGTRRPPKVRKRTR